jgi:putative ABC transport system permease protein
MNRLMFYCRYALRSLRRDGVRSALAVLSITFGVLSLVSMYLLSGTLLNGSMFDQRLQYGGDLQILPPTGQTSFTTADLAQIATWQEQGLIGRATPLAQGRAQYLRTPQSGRVTFLMQAVGIDPQQYPLVGELTLREPRGLTAAEVLHQTGDALITRDIADQLGLTIGSSILIDGTSGPYPLNITGIVSQTPSYVGDSMFYTLETARDIAGQPDVITTLLALTTSPSPDLSPLIDSPYRVYVAVSRENSNGTSSTTNLFDMMLKGAGILGLLVGGLSVSNTLQVILARRKLEIAMLKTLGFRQSDLLALMAIETGILGCIGGILGTGLGTFITSQLLEMLSGSGSLLLQWTPSPVILTAGVLTGIVTAVAFGMQAILIASATRPIQLLRNLPPIITFGTQVARLMLYGALVLVFGLLVGVLVGSPLEGVLYVAGGSIILAALRAGFWVLLWGILAIPLPLGPLVRLAWASLRQRKQQSSLALMALATGAFSVTFAALILHSAQLTVTDRRGTDDGYNLMVLTTPEQSAGVQSTLIQHGAQAVYGTRRTPASLNQQPVMLEARQTETLTQDMFYSGHWDESSPTALLPELENGVYAVGDELSVQVEGQTLQLTTAGFYQPAAQRMGGGENAVIVPAHILDSIPQTAVQTLVYGMFPVGQLDSTTNIIGQALPQMLVISRADLNDWVHSSLMGLFSFAASIAGLALAAGAVLIANSAGLTVIERRREIGVFKAVGYTSRRVLALLLIEYGMLGALAGLLGVIGASAAITLISLSQPAAEVWIEPWVLAAMLMASIGIALISAASVAWQPTHIRPMEVLRYE